MLNLNAILRLSQDVTDMNENTGGVLRLRTGVFFTVFKSQNVTKKRAEDALTQLRDAAYIRASRLFGYPVGDESDGTETGDTPMLPHWLWSEDGGSEPGAQRRRQGGKTYGQL